jgi:hypothetical protein
MDYLLGFILIEPLCQTAGNPLASCLGNLTSAGKDEDLNQ